MKSRTEWGEVWQPGGVPVPDLGYRGSKGRELRFPPGNEKARRWLTGGLPAPTVERDGHDKCMACGGRVSMLLIDTHVPGAWPTRMMERHHCSQKVGA